MRPYLFAEREGLSDIFPTEYQGNIWNTAATPHTFIMVRLTAENIIEAPRHRFPNMLAIIPEYNLDAQMPLEVFLELYNKIPLVVQERIQQCETCEGEGTFYHDNHPYRCKTCKETGEIKTGELENVKDPSYVISINGIKHSPEHFYKLLRTAELSETKTITVKHVMVESFKASIFHLGPDIIIGIAPKTFSEEETPETINEVTLNIRMK